MSHALGWSAILVVVTPLVGSCQESTSGSAPVAPAAPKAEQITQSKGSKLVADVDGNVVTAQLIEETECEWVVRAPGGGYSRESGWKTCSSKPIPNASIELEAGGGSLTATTNISGETTFDLTQLSGVKTRPALASLTVVGNALPQRATIALLSTPFYASWEQARDAEKQERAAQQQRELAERMHATNVAMVQEIEDGLAKLTPKRIDEAQLVLFQSLVTKLKDLTSRPAFLEEDKARVLALTEKLRKLSPAYDAALEAAVARDDQAYLANGWEAMKSKLVSPASANLVGVKVLLRCPRGRIIVYQFDSQNRFGAMLRGTGVVKINAEGGFNARVEGERITGFDGNDLGPDPFVVLIQAAQRGDCSQMQ